MGLENDEYVKKTYVNIVDGKWAVRCKKDDPKAEERFSEKKKELVYEIKYKSLSGMIAGMNIKTTEFGSVVLELSLVDVMDSFQLTIPVDSKYFDTFCDRILNVNLNAEVVLIPYSFEGDQGGKISGMNIYQGGREKEHKVLPFYTREDPKDKPKPEGEVGPDGRLLKDDWEIYKKRERKFFKELITKLNEGFLPSSKRVVPEKGMAANTGFSDPENDLPF